MASGPYHVGILNSETQKYEISISTGSDLELALRTMESTVKYEHKTVQLFKEISTHTEVKVKTLYPEGE